MAGKNPYLSFFISYLSLTAAFPLSTDSRWIVDETGQRVKLACASWPSHMEAVVAEGLSKQPVDVISQNIASNGFNCVRFTWPLYLATNDTIANYTTVRKSFQSLGFNDAIAGFQANNPSIIDLTLIQAFQEVVASLSRNNVMVILDNHISKPGWCCGYNDGNGFFGDQYFDPDLWIKGLTNMATLFKDIPNVIGMSLRNELRGPRENVNDWYKYMQKGAEAVHEANPNVLVILSGLSWDTDMSFLYQSPLNLSFTKKTVFEVHKYSFTDGSAWDQGNPNDVCGQILNIINARAGFLLDQGYPLFMSEWGFDQRGTNVNDNKYMNCFMGWFAEFDVDWALWTLAGSYYVREGSVGPDEVYGILNYNWKEIRNSSNLARISSIQAPFQGPGISNSKPHKLIYHPLTGLCIIRKSLLEPLSLGPCANSEAWDYTKQKTLKIKGTYFCLKADQLTKPAKLGIICKGSGTKWNTISSSGMHLSSTLGHKNRTKACLDVDLSSNVIIMSTCKCLSIDRSCDPSSQWFKIIDSTRTTRGKTKRTTRGKTKTELFNLMVNYVKRVMYELL